MQHRLALLRATLIGDEFVSGVSAAGFYRLSRAQAVAGGAVGRPGPGGSWSTACRDSAEGPVVVMSVEAAKRRRRGEGSRIAPDLHRTDIGAPTEVPVHSPAAGSQRQCRRRKLHPDARIALLETSLLEQAT